MPLDEKAVISDVTALEPEQRKSLWRLLPESVDKTEVQELLTGLIGKVDKERLGTFVLETMKGLGTADKAAVATASLKALPPEQQKAVQEAVNTAGLPVPDDTEVLARLWLIVIRSFSAVLVGSFLVLGYGILFVDHLKIEPALILSMFTSVVGFLAGLFVPSPTRSKSAASPRN